MNEQIADQIAHNVYQALGLQMAPESLTHSMLGTAWSMGMPEPANGWRDVTPYYHYEETLALIYLAMEAEILCGFVTKIMHLAESELGVPVRASGLNPQEVFRSLTKWSYAHAAHRAHAAGAANTLNIERTDDIFGLRASPYRELIGASVSNTDAIPIADFQLGPSREHPWTAFPCKIADNICETLEIENNRLHAIILQVAVSKKRTAFYESVQKNLA